MNDLGNLKIYLQFRIGKREHCRMIHSVPMLTQAEAELIYRNFKQDHAELQTHATWQPREVWL